MNEAEINWTNGLSERIEQLSADGASNEMIDLYVAARKAGDPASVEQVMAAIRLRGPESSKREDSVVEDAIRSIRIAALRTEVNRLEGGALLRYVLFVLELSARLVDAGADSVNWENAEVTQGLAEHVRKAAIEWLRVNPCTQP